MIGLIVRRLLQMPVILLVIYTITFLLAWSLPGESLLNDEGRRPPQSVIDLAPYVKVKGSKVKVKKAVNFIGSFQTVVSQEAARSDVDGVICGHIHHATIETIAGIHYINTGDWVESCTAVGEDHAGRFSIMHWAKVQQAQTVPQRAVAPIPFDAEAA